MTSPKQVESKAHSISWECSVADGRTIGRIVDRAEALAARQGVNFDAKCMTMDLIACHANGTPLDLKKLEKFTDADFGHDVFGIRRFMNRVSGELGGCFLPRCAMPATGGVS